MTTVYPTPSVVEAAALVQQSRAAASAATSVAQTLASAPRVGSVLVALISVDSATVSVSSIAQAGVTWTSWMSKSGTGVSALAWLGVVTTSAATSVTVTLSASADVSVELSEWSGINVDAAILVTGAGNSGTGQTADSGDVVIPTVETSSGAVTPDGLVISLLAFAANATTSIAGPGLNDFSAATGTGTSAVGMASSWLDKALPAPTYEYWVSATGNDSNPGTQDLPFLTFSGVASVINKLDLTNSTGVLVHLSAGQYVWGFNQHGNVTNTTTSASAPIRIVADTPGSAVLYPTYPVIYSESDYLSISGLVIDCTGITGAAPALVIGTGAPYTARHNVIEDCTWRNLTSGQCINAGYASDGLVVRRCKFINYTGVLSGTSNTAAITVSAPSAQIVNNLFVGVFSVGVWCQQNATQPVITNNTFCALQALSGAATLTSIGIIVGCSAGTCDYALVANNIIRDCAYGVKEYVSGSGAMGTHNLYLNNDVYNCTTPYTFITGAQTGGIALDPLFVNYQTNGSGDYHLTSSSPCIDAGQSAGAPDDDFDGYARPVGSAYDIGCYEYGASASGTYRGVWTLGASSVNWAALIGVLRPLASAPSSGFNGYYRAITREEGAVAYFRMNEPAGALSVVDNALPGTYQGNLSATGVVLGYGGMLASDPATSGAALFDGATGSVTTTYTPSSMSAFSLRAWLAWDGVASAGASPRIASTDVVATDNAGFELYITPNSGAPTITGAASNGTSVATVTSSAQVPWLFTRTQVFLTYDGATLRLYLNGALASSSALSGAVAAALHSLTIGADPTGANYFAGLLQDVAVFPTALSAAQIEFDYIAGVRGPVTQQSAASQYGFKQQLVMVYSSSGAFIDVWRDAPLLAGVKYALNSATTPIRVQLPRKFDDFDEVGAPNARGSIGQGNVVQYYVFGPGLPVGGLLKYQGVIDAYAPQIAENGEESVTVTITPFDSTVGDHGLLGDATFGTPNVSTTYVDPVAIFNYWFKTIDSLTNLPYAHPLTLDPNNPTSSGVSVQYTFASQQLSSIFSTITQMLPANWYWRVNGDKTVTLNVPPVTAQHVFVIGQHIVSPQYKKDWTRLRNVVRVVGTGVSVSLTSALSAGVAVTSLPVSTTPIDIPSGTNIIINDGGNPTDTFTTNADTPAGSSSIAVTSQAPASSYTAQTLASIAVAATVQGSDLNTYGARVMQLADNRVTDLNTAVVLADGLLTQYDQMILRTKIRVVDYRGDAGWGLGYDIESIQPGDTCQILNPSNSGNALSQVAIIYALSYGFDYVDLELGYFIPEDARDLMALRTQFQDFSLGR